MSKKKDRGHRKSPQLPCFVYRGLTTFQWALIVIPISLFFIYLSSYGIFMKSLLSFLAIGTFIILIKQDHNVRKVYLTNKTLEITLGFNERQTIDLWDHYILIDEQRGGALGNVYSYKARLVSKDIAEPHLRDGNIFQMGWHIKHTHYKDTQNSEKQSKFVGRPNTIPLSPSIFTPENLKEYVESIQVQTTPPLHVIFTSEQLRKDYNTGQYRAK